MPSPSVTNPKPTTSVTKRVKRPNKSPSKRTTTSLGTDKNRVDTDTKSTEERSKKLSNDTATQTQRARANKARKSLSNCKANQSKLNDVRPTTNEADTSFKLPRKRATTLAKSTTSPKPSNTTANNHNADATLMSSRRNLPTARTQRNTGNSGGSSPTQAPVIVNKFSLKAEEQPQRAKTKRRTASTKKKRQIEADAKQASSGRDGVEDGDDTMTPDVLFQKRMTREKLNLLNSSPLAKLISEEDKDAAAEEIYGKGAKFESVARRLKRKHNEVQDEEDDIIPLDINATRGSKKANSSLVEKDYKNDATKAAAEKKEARKLRRKVRQLRSKGELPTEEREFTETGVMYLGHIPHGFYEKEMHGYFSQYGEITRLRLSRSKKTARSRGFAFIEFADKDVAMAAAKSMDGYLMHGQSLVAKMMDPEKVHPDTFKGANRTFRKVPFSAIERRALIQRARDPLKLAQRSRGVQKNLKRKKHKLAHMNIAYDFPEISPSTEA